jgi:hypothetical protein
MMTTTPLQQGHQHQLEGSNNAIAMRATTPLQIKGNDAIVTRSTTPSKWRQACLRIDNGNDAIVMRVTIAIATTEKTLRIDGNNTIATWVTLPAQQLAMRATTLAWLRRRHACPSTMAMTPWWRERQLPLQQRQRRLHIDGNNASLLTSSKGDDINDDDDAIATRAATPAWGQQQCHHNEGNKTAADQGQQRHCYKGDGPSLTTARTPAYQQQQQLHCHEGNNRDGNNGKDACALTATTPSWQGQQPQLNNKQQGWRH